MEEILHIILDLKKKINTIEKNHNDEKILNKIKKTEKEIKFFKKKYKKNRR